MLSSKLPFFGQDMYRPPRGPVAWQNDVSTRSPYAPSLPGGGGDVMRPGPFEQNLPAGAFVLGDSNPTPRSPRPVGTVAQPSVRGGAQGAGPIPGLGNGMNAMGGTGGYILGSSVGPPQGYGAGLAPASGLGGGLYPSLISLFGG